MPRFRALHARYACVDSDKTALLWGPRFTPKTRWRCAVESLFIPRSDTTILNMPGAHQVHL